MPTLIEVIWCTRLFILAILHPIVNMAQDGIDRIFLSDVEREKRYQVVVLNLVNSV
jgi:hypothetical protein